MNDQDLREMIRASIARHSALSAVSGSSATDELRLNAGAAFAVSPAFARLPLLRSGDEDGACIIEPSVRCNHCGYCLSFGH
jgi:hypothetical protein